MARTNNLSNFLTDVADAIRTKKGSEELIVAADFDTEIENLPSGGTVGTVDSKDVDFYDYDGTRVYSYTASEFLQLTEMPENPTHDGLTSQGWNWTLSDAKAQVTLAGMLDVGQLYVTDDGSTRIYITVSEDNFSPYMTVSGTVPITVNWGDGTTEEVTTNGTTIQHTYSQAGKYVIKQTPASGENSYIQITGSQYSGSKILWANDTSLTTEYTRNTSFHCAVDKIECGPYNIFSDYSLTDLRCLKSISFSNNVSWNVPNGLRNCYSLKCLILKSTPYIGFPYTYSLNHVCLPKSMTDGYRMGMRSNPAIESLMIHGTYSGNNTTFSGTIDKCTSLQRLSLPESITKLSGSNFSDCYSLRRVHIPSTLTEFAGSVFSGCYSLSEINLPSGLTKIGNNCFALCCGLVEVIMPNTVTTLGSGAYQKCYGLKRVKMSSGVTDVLANTFLDCFNVEYYDFSEHEQVPTLSAVSAFSNISSDCKIIVPDNLYNDWIVANNWSTYASNIISKTDWNALQS